MRRTTTALGFLLASVLALDGCAKTTLQGLYRPQANDVAEHEEPRVLASGSEWVFLWGMVPTGDFDLNMEMERSLRENEGLTDVEVEDHLSIGGFFLWLVTAGIVSHHSVTATGQVVIVRDRAAPPTPTPAPAPPPPAAPLDGASGPSR